MALMDRRSDDEKLNNNLLFNSNNKENNQILNIANPYYHKSNLSRTDYIQTIPENCQSNFQMSSRIEAPKFGERIEHAYTDFKVNERIKDKGKGNGIEFPATNFNDKNINIEEIGKPKENELVFNSDIIYNRFVDKTYSTNVE